jgi:secreted PhoX family phosphatase
MPDEDSIPVNPSSNEPVCINSFKEINRRSALKISAAGLSAAAISCSAQQQPKKNTSFLPFKEIDSIQTADIRLADGFKYESIVSFGDPLKNGIAPYDPKKLSAEEQQFRFGGNCDYIHFFEDKKDSSKGIICVNNESPEYGQHPDKKEREKAAYYSVGCSIAALVKRNGRWQVDLNSFINRRITPDTKAVITGPAAGNNRLKSSASPDGIISAGTLGNCAGGFTPWGTYLTAEENIQSYFTGDTKKHKESKNMKRFGMSGKNHFFHKVSKRFNLNSDAQSPLHYGWVVEIDPYNPDEPIKKHSLLGRAKHECATTTIDKNGHIVVYTSDDQTFEYIYKFVSAKKYKEGDRAHNKTLLESGTLYAARFNKDGSLGWQPLIHGKNGLTKENGFASQGDILLDTRSAADKVGATPMDRPEDIAIHPKTGKVYFFMTGNRSRKGDRLNAANKVAQGSGHVIEMSADHHSEKNQWNFLLICGKHLADNENASFHSNTSQSGRFVYPDNGSFDSEGNMWICSDGYGFPGFSDGLWHCQIDGSRALTTRMATAPLRAEFTGPCFTSDGKDLFLAVQHPGTGKSGGFPEFNGKRARSTVVIISRS